MERRLGFVVRMAAAVRSFFRHPRRGRCSTRRWISVLPDFVIAGCNLLDFQARVFAGLVVGWIHKPVALGVERTYGRGRIVASTFRLFQDAPLADPTAATLLDTMITLSLESREHRLEEAVRAAEFAA